MADQTKKHLDEITGIARINNALIGALSMEFGLTMTNKTKIDSTKEDYGIALFWYMIINHVEKFGRAQYDTIQKQMMEPDDKHRNPQGIILWLDRHFRAFEVATEPIAPADKTRIFLRMIETQLGKDMLIYVRRLPHDFRTGDKNPDYEAYTRAIIQHVEEELDFPATPTKRIQVMAAEEEPTVASPEERIRLLEEKLAKMTKPARGASKHDKDKDDKTFVKWGLQRKQAAGDPPGIWAPDACCAYHLYVEGKVISKNAKHYHTNLQCKVQAKKE